MASSVIHLCIAKELNKYLNKDSKKLLIGSIAPDISKHLNETKKTSHFFEDEEEIPSINKFLNKYNNYLDDDFVLGYYIHLYTDYLWYKYFITNYDKDDFVYDLNGNKLNLSEEEKLKYFYNDYTNLNITLIDVYNLDLSMFYEEIPTFDNIIEEISMDKINLIVEKVGIIIENSKEKKNYIFNDKSIVSFINFAVNFLLDNLKQIKML